MYTSWIFETQPVVSDKWPRAAGAARVTETEGRGSNFRFYRSPYNFSTNKGQEKLFISMTYRSNGDHIRSIACLRD